MGRPPKPGHLAPRQPATVLGWTMRKLRRVAGFSVSEMARRYGCSTSHVSRVERGTAKATSELVELYEETFAAEGMLLSLFQVAEYLPVQERRRFHGRPRLVRAIEGDASTFVEDTIPHGTLMTPGMPFVKTWWIRNSGTVPWRGRQLERQGPLTGPGLITSPTRQVPVPDTNPGDTAEIQALLQAPGYDCTSIAYFKMADEDGFVCFPDNYQLGLDVLVRVAGQVPVSEVPVTSAASRAESKNAARGRDRKRV